MKFNMERKYVIRRRVVFAIFVIIVSSLFTYGTRDVCYVGTDKDYANALGYGSCNKMLDEVIGVNK